MVFPNHASKCKGEIGFSQFCARPFFAALLACFPAADKRLLATIDENVALWREQGELPDFSLP